MPATLCYETCAALPAVSPERRRALLDGPSDLDTHHWLYDEIAALHLTEAMAPPAPVASGDSARILVWNAQRGRHPDEAAALLAGQGAAVNLLCELDNGMARTAQRHTARDLAQRLGQGYAYAVEFIELGLGDRRERAALAGRENALGFHGGAILSPCALARPVLERLRDDTGCATHLCVRDGRDVVYLLRVPGRSVVSSSVGVGTRLPAHATSLGRVFLADLEAQELAELYAGATLTRHSAHTPGTLGELTRLLQADRERGFVISEGFYEKGINAIAGPVRDAGGRVVAVINLIARDGEADSAQLHGELLERVLAAAAQLSTALAYQPRAAAGARR